MHVKSLGLLIFDCDGVLIDSEIIAARVLAKSLTGAGFVASAEQALELGWGKTAVSLAAAVEERYGRSLPDGFVEQMRAELAEAYARDLEPIEGVFELLRASEVPRCVASNSQIDRVRLKLTLTGLLEFFDPHLFSASMVTRSKPEPDLFQFAGARFGAKPEQCLVIEDSILGVMAARAAGMRVFGFTGGSHCPPAHANRLRSAGCTEVFGSMNELHQFLRA